MTVQIAGTQYRVLDTRVDSGYGPYVGPLAPGSYVIGGPTFPGLALHVGCAFVGNIELFNWTGYGSIYMRPHGYPNLSPYRFAAFGGPTPSAWPNWAFTVGCNEGFDLVVQGASVHVVIDMMAILT